MNQKNKDLSMYNKFRDTILYNCKVSIFIVIIAQCSAGETVGSGLGIKRRRGGGFINRTKNDRK